MDLSTDVMRIVGRGHLSRFCESHADARKWIEHWLAEAEEAVWTAPHDIKARFASASFLPGNTVIFNVKGNDYRLEVSVAYRSSVVVVNWIGTHAAYQRRNKSR
jgi:Uncharacterized protein conserved in bacteria